MNNAAQGKSEILLAIGIDMGMGVIDTGVSTIDTSIKQPPKGCPECGGNNLEYDSYDFWGDGTSSQEASCVDCYAAWQEIYHFNRIEITESGNS